MKITDLKLTPLVQAFLDAGRELSYDVLDVNGASQLGQLLSLLVIQELGTHSWFNQPTNHAAGDAPYVNLKKKIAGMDIINES